MAATPSRSYWVFKANQSIVIPSKSALCRSESHLAISILSCRRQHMPHLNNFVCLTDTVLGQPTAGAQHRLTGYAARLEVLRGPSPLPSHWGLREEHTLSSIHTMHGPLAAAVIKESLWQCEPSAPECLTHQSLNVQKLWGRVKAGDKDREKGLLAQVLLHCPCLCRHLSGSGFGDYPRCLSQARRGSGLQQ